MFQSKPGEKTIALPLIALVLTSLIGLPGCNKAEVRTDTDHEQAAATATATDTASESWNFDDVSVGELPAGWIVDATNTKGDLATWQVVEDTTAPSGDQVLALTVPGYIKGQTYNVCWTDSISFLDGEIEVSFKAVTGEIDQGGGVVWRFQDIENYYIARFNPLENNFRIYHVIEGVREIMADIEIPPPAGQWHTMRIVQHGNQFEGYIDGEMLLSGTDDSFTDAGAVGVWTKADAVTSFDDFSVRPSEVK